MNADQERRVKFEAETNYNKRFRLSRRDCIGTLCDADKTTPTTETQRHGEKQKSEESSPRRRGEDRNFFWQNGADIDRRDMQRLRREAFLATA
jgi:hypothetical protein